MAQSGNALQGAKWEKEEGEKGAARAGSPSFFSGVRGFSPSTDQQGFPERLRETTVIDEALLIRS